MNTYTATREELLAEYTRLINEKARLVAAGQFGEIAALAPRIGAALGELQFRFGVTKDELNAIRIAAMEAAKPAPALPTWAASIEIYWANPKSYQPIQMIRGDELRPCDVVFYSDKANPRLLKAPIGQGDLWQVIKLVDHFGMLKRFPAEETINPTRWYVVLRMVKTSV